MRERRRDGRVIDGAPFEMPATSEQVQLVALLHPLRLVGAERLDVVVERPPFPARRHLRAP